MTQNDSRQNTNIFARRSLFGTQFGDFAKYALHLSALEFIGHAQKLVPLARRVNQAVSLNNSRPISMRRISEVPAPIS